MNNLLKNIFLIFILSMLFFSCEKKAQLPANKFAQHDSTSKEMIKLNELLNNVESHDIKAYIDSSSLSFKLSKFGFWYAITQEGNGKPFIDGDKVMVEYQVQTLQGTFCYSYRGQNTKLITLGKGDHQRGFNTALSLLKEGGSAEFIVPSNLAYGLMGDMNKIPPRATLIYKVFSVKHK